MISSVSGNEETVEKLLSLSAYSNIHNNKGLTPLHMACEKGHLGVAQLLLMNNAKLNVTDFLGETPLYKSVRAKNKTLTKFLIAQHAVVNNANNINERLIHMAVMFDDIELAEVLLKVKQNPNAVTDAGKFELLSYLISNLSLVI